MIRLAYAALCIFVFSIPWENTLVIPGIGVVTRLTGVVAASIAVLAIVVSGRVRRWHVFHGAALLFVIWIACAHLFFHSSDRLPYKFWTFVQLFLVLLMIWELARSAQRQLVLLTAYVSGAYVAAVDTILAYHRGAEQYGRFQAAGFDPNELAMTLALALPMAWYLGMSYRRPLLRWFCRAYLPIGLVGIGLTGSRGGMLVSVIALLIVPLSLTRLSPGRLVAAIATLGLSGALAVAYVPTTLVERLGTTGTEVEDLRFGGRFKLWVAGVRAFAQRPIVGYGTGAFKRAITPQLGAASQVAHNSFLSVLVEQGIVGLLFFLVMFIAVFRAVLKLSHLELRFALVLLGALVAAMLPLTWEDSKPVWFILGSLMGLCQAWLVDSGWGRQPPRPVQATVRAVRAREPLPSPTSGAVHSEDGV